MSSTKLTPRTSGIRSPEPSPAPSRANTSNSPARTSAGASAAAWGGRERATDLALEGILERVRRAKGAATPEERALANVCELRRAVASGEWLERLTPDCHDQLAATRFALNEVGAMSVAAHISETMAALHFKRSPQQREALLLRLERDLHAAGPTLDGLIARYAQHLLDAGIQAALPAEPRSTAD